MSSTKTQNIYNIPASISFVDALAAKLLSEAKNKEELTTHLILLPTRRACRSLRDAFLKLSEGKPILLPRLQAIGDIDDKELFLAGAGEQEISIPPAISSLKRQILLSRTISQLPDFTKGPEQDMALARALGELIDQIHTENLTLDDLPKIVDQTEFADHWQITIDFLTILSHHWPRILKEEGCIDIAERRNKLILSLNDHWQQNPPDFPVIAAGSTGSIPATAKLLKTISRLPQGAIILPGLDTRMSPESWDAIKEGHPQTTIKQLLERLEVERKDIKPWSTGNSNETRETLVSEVMLPADSTNEWQNALSSPQEKEKITNTLKDIKRYDCETPQQEADLIAVILRESLEQKDKTTTLITPDRNLARRVAVACRRWNIDIDDSGGQSLSNHPLGTYLSSCAKTCLNQQKPASLLSLLKHQYCAVTGVSDFRSITQTMEKNLLRGPAPKIGFEGLKERCTELKQPETKINDLINRLEQILGPLTQKLNDGFHPFIEFLDAHIQAAETMASQTLWQGNAGEKSAIFLAELRQEATYFPKMTGSDYVAVFNELIKSVTIRPQYGTHPRLAILGQLEARLVQADRVILAGMNEGTWPPNADHDPWMSRPMREQYGLPTTERKITLAAHDFACALCNKEVFITRSERIDGTPTVPSRWLQRLETFLKATNIDSDCLHNGPHKLYLRQLSKVKEIKPVERPKPKPPVNTRPTELSVTKIETWLKDPYSIYASKILDLKKLDPLEKQVDAAQKGSMLHEVLYQFTRKHGGNLHQATQNDFIAIARSVIEETSNNNGEWHFWMPRLMRLSTWLINHEKFWQQKSSFLKGEIKGEVTLSKNLDRPFKLTARADRIDKIKTGGAAIIDYKSGGTYSKNKILSGELPQLSLEALILSNKGFSEINEQEVTSMGYWKLTGGSKPAEIIEIDEEQKIDKAITAAKEGIANLINTFERQETPYYAIPNLDKAPSYNDYEHLERVKEWAALDEASEEAA